MYFWKYFNFKNLIIYIVFIYIYIFILHTNLINHVTYTLLSKKSKAGDCSQGWPEGSLFNCYNTKV